VRNVPLALPCRGRPVLPTKRTSKKKAAPRDDGEQFFKIKMT
jgi:hypothetical protein